MKKRWIASGIAGALVLSGAGIGYEAYAEQSVEGWGLEVQEVKGQVDVDASGLEPKTQETETSESTASSTDEAGIEKTETAEAVAEIQVVEKELVIESDQNTPNYLVDRDSIPAEKKILPEVLIESNGNLTNKAHIASRDYGYGLQQSATYFSLDGKQYYVSQHDVEGDEGILFLQNAESTYKEPARTIKIGEYDGVVIEGQFRRAVHFLIDDQLFCVACWGLNAEELIMIAEQIAARA